MQPLWIYSTTEHWICCFCLLNCRFWEDSNRSQIRRDIVDSVQRTGSTQISTFVDRLTSEKRLIDLPNPYLRIRNMTISKCSSSLQDETLLPAIIRLRIGAWRRLLRRSVQQPNGATDRTFSFIILWNLCDSNDKSMHRCISPTITIQKVVISCPHAWMESLRRMYSSLRPFLTKLSSPHAPSLYPPS